MHNTDRPKKEEKKNRSLAQLPLTPARGNTPTSHLGLRWPGNDPAAIFVTERERAHVRFGDLLARWFVLRDKQLGSAQYAQGLRRWRTTPGGKGDSIAGLLGWDNAPLLQPMNERSGPVAAHFEAFKSFPAPPGRARELWDWERPNGSFRIT